MALSDHAISNLTTALLFGHVV